MCAGFAAGERADLKFCADAAGKHYRCRFRLGKRYTGPPGHCHGGIIATILDDAMSKLNKLRDQPIARSARRYRAHDRRIFAASTAT